jgi:hypothetical protein
MTAVRSAADAPTAEGFSAVGASMSLAGNG